MVGSNCMDLSILPNGFKGVIQEGNGRLFIALKEVRESAGGSPHVQAEQPGDFLDNFDSECW